MKIKKLVKWKQKRLKKKLAKYEIKKMGRLMAGELINNYDPEWPDAELTKKEKELLAERYEVTQTLAEIKKERRYKKRDFLYYRYWPAVYKRAAKKGVDEKLALFVNDHYEDVPDNMVSIYELLKEKGFRCEAIMKPHVAKKGLLRQVGFFLYFRNFTKRYAQAKYLFFTEYFLPLYANKPQPGTHTVQLWHASGAFKKWGYSTQDAAWGGNREQFERFPIHNTYTDVFVSAPAVINAYDDAFHCGTEIIRPLGTPRTDEFYRPGRIEEGRAKIEELCPGIDGRKIILYAPTFRGNSLRKSYIKDTLNYKILFEELSDKYVFVNKLHPLVKKGFSLSPELAESASTFLFDVSKEASIADALCAADIVISDYSSLIFDYSLLERPMIFYAYDLEEYVADRSFYYPYEDFVPGPIVKDTETLITAIKDMEENFDKDRVHRFREKFMSACDGHATKRIVDYLLDQE